jgi:DNA (cytosine-5)-methyltransferase 1
LIYLQGLEAARLQGYPIDSWYEIPVSDNQAYKQFGNSVSVPVVTTIANEIKKQLLK